MSEIKGFNIYMDLNHYGLGIDLFIEPDFPTLIQITFLCFTFEINRWSYWKN